MAAPAQGNHDQAFLASIGAAGNYTYFMGHAAAPVYGVIPQLMAWAGVRSIGHGIYFSERTRRPMDASEAEFERLLQQGLAQDGMPMGISASFKEKHYSFVEFDRAYFTDTQVRRFIETAKPHAVGGDVRLATVADMTQGKLPPDRTLVRVPDALLMRMTCETMLKNGHALVEHHLALASRFAQGQAIDAVSVAELNRVYGSQGYGISTRNIGGYQLVEFLPMIGNDGKILPAAFVLDNSARNKIPEMHPTAAGDIVAQLAPQVNAQAVTAATRALNPGERLAAGMPPRPGGIIQRS